VSKLSLKNTENKKNIGSHPDNFRVTQMTTD